MLPPRDTIPGGHGWHPTKAYPPICNIPGYNWARDDLIDIVIRDLRDRGFGCRANPGPRVCTQVACTDLGVAVFICNELPHELQIDCETVADYAQDIKDRCNNSPLTTVLDAQGQEFAIGGWNVVVGGRGPCVI